MHESKPEYEPEILTKYEDFNLAQLIGDVLTRQVQIEAAAENLEDQKLELYKLIGEVNGELMGSGMMMANAILGQEAEYNPEAADALNRQLDDGRVVGEYRGLSLPATNNDDLVIYHRVYLGETAHTTDDMLEEAYVDHFARLPISSPNIDLISPPSTVPMNDYLLEAVCDELLYSDDPIPDPALMLEAFTAVIARGLAGPRQNKIEWFLDKVNERLMKNAEVEIYTREFLTYDIDEDADEDTEAIIPPTVHWHTSQRPFIGILLSFGVISEYKVMTPHQRHMLPDKVLVAHIEEDGEIVQIPMRSCSSIEPYQY